MRKTFVIAVLVFTAASIGLGQKQSARRAPKSRVDQVIRQVDHERIQAQIAGDAATLDRIYADDYTLVNVSGIVTTKAQRLAAIKSGEIKYESVSVDEVNIRSYGDTAVVTDRATVKLQDKGQDLSGQYRVTLTFVKIKGTWQLVAAQNTRITEQ